MDHLRNRTVGLKVPLVKFYLMPHWIVFAFCLAILCGAFILTPAESGLQLRSIPIPSVCLFHNLTGLPCPGCGLSQSITAAVHGDLAGSFSYHKLGLITLVYVVMQFVFRLKLIVSPSIRPRLQRREKLLNQGMVILGVIFGLNWIFTLMLN